MKSTRPFAFLALVLSASTIALPMRDVAEIDIRADPSIIENRAASEALANIVERGLSESVFGFKRELKPANELHARFTDDAEELYERYLDDEDFYTRSFVEDSDELVERNILSKAKGFLGGVLGFKKRDEELVVVRDSLDGLAERSFLSKIGNVFKKVAGVVLRRSPEETLAARDVSDGVVERSFFSKIGNVFKKAASFILRRSPEDTLATRDVSDGVVERSFFSKIGNVFKKAASFILRRSREETLATRDVSDGVVERSFFSKIGKAFKKVASFILRRSPEKLSTRSEEELSTRMEELEELEELFERYYDEELVARSGDDFLYARDYEFEDAYY